MFGLIRSFKSLKVHGIAERELRVSPRTKSILVGAPCTLTHIYGGRKDGSEYITPLDILLKILCKVNWYERPLIAPTHTRRIHERLRNE